MNYKNFVLLFLPFASFGQANPVKVTLHDELKQLYAFQLLPEYRSNTVEGQESSYDRNGGNNDGKGRWAYIRRNEDSSLVMLDVDGPGVINRFATPDPGMDTIDFYLDHSQTPTLSIYYPDLFNGKVFPFVAPLCGHALGGYYSYFPIMFRRHCLIVCRGKFLSYHQIQYRLYPAGTAVATFSVLLGKEEKRDLQRIAAAWTNPPNIKGKRLEFSGLLAPGQVSKIAQWSKGGRINGIKLDTTGALDCRLRIYWDNETYPAIDCPVSEFFGYALKKPAMQSVLIGSKDNWNYIYFPMPFSRTARIELVNESSQSSHRVNALIWYDGHSRQSASEGYFCVNRKNVDLLQTEPFHVFLDVTGRGHYVGTILIGEGAYRSGTHFWEGDDTLATDGIYRVHGTGTEDYFNGGWYSEEGRWDRAMSLPLSGCLGYSWINSWTGGYRLMLSDKVPFEKSIYQGIEHGDSPLKALPVHYKSVAFYYLDRPFAGKSVSNKEGNSNSGGSSSGL